MQISREDRVLMERAHVRAWPALNTADIDGWLWRSSGGGSQRANSVSTIDFRGTSAEIALAEAESRYQARGETTRFQTFDETSPNELANLLQERGYRQSEATMTMYRRIEDTTFKRIEDTTFKRIEDTTAVADVEARDDAWVEWRAIYLGEITKSRRAVNALILDRIPGPRAFFGCRRDGEIVATALCAVSFGCAVIECVATRADVRRRGTAKSLLTALERWASRQSVDWLGLQVAAGNAPAVALYHRLGFVTGATNRFWMR